MKRNYFALVAILGFGFLSACKQAGNEPNPGGGASPDDPRNIREVANLLRSAGKLPEPPAPKTTLVGEKSQVVGSAPDHTFEYSGRSRDCDKVVSEESYDYIGRSDEFAILDPWASVLWPGCLIQGGSIRGDQVPTAIPIASKRKPGKILLQIVSGADPRLTGENKEGSWSEDVAVMDESSVLQAQNNLIRRWRDSGVPASTSYSLQVIHSIKEAAIATGLDIDKDFGKITASFRTNFKEDRSYVLAKLYQRFYTLSYQDPEGFKGVFKDNIQRSDLEPYTGPGNPICYISSVSYGRVYYLLYESSTSTDSLLTSLNVTLNKVTVSGSIHTNEVLNRSKVYLIQRGGDAEAGLQGALSHEKVADFIIKGATPSPKNVGAPISFTVKHLYDASLVRMSNTLSYSYKKTQFIPKSKANTVTILLRDINVRTRVKNGWEISNNGYVRLKDARVEFDSKRKAKSRIKFTEFIHRGEPLEAGLRHTAYLNVYKSVTADCGFDPDDRYDRVLLRVKLEVRPESYHEGLIGDRNGEGPHVIEFIQELEYSSEGWDVLPATTGYTQVPYQSLSTSRELEQLYLDIDMNYSVYIDNVRLRPVNKKK
jgi:listeriolysin O